MTRKYLLHQRRARARQTDDEYRIGVGRSETCALREKFRVEQLFAALDMPRKLIDVIAATLETQAVPLRVVAE